MSKKKGPGLFLHKNKPGPKLCKNKPGPFLPKNIKKFAKNDEIIKKQ